MLDDAKMQASNRHSQVKVVISIFKAQAVATLDPLLSEPYQ